MRRWIWVVLGVAIIAGATFGVIRWRANRGTANQRYDGKTVAEWVELLDAIDASASVRDLRSQGEAALPVLLEARKSPNLRVHRRAIELLIAVGPPAVEPLIEALPHAGARVELALVRLGPTAVPGLEKSLSGKDGAAAARLLGLIGGRAIAAVPALVGLVQDGGADKATRVAAVNALARIGAELGPEVLGGTEDLILPTMIAALASEDLRLPAARALATYGTASKPAIPDLVRLVKDKSPELSAAVCQALGATLDPSAALPLVSQLGRDDRAAQAAALALARLGRQGRQENLAVPALIAALKKAKQAGQLARAVLERLDAALPLSDALQDPDEAIRLGAAEVLALLGPRATMSETCVHALVLRLSDGKPAVALAAAQALVRVDPPWDITSIAPLDRPTPWVASRAVAPLGKLLASEDKTIAAGATYVLADLGSLAKPLVPELLTMLGGKDETRAARAAVLLGGMKPPTREMLDALEAGLNGTPVVQDVCIESLGRLGDAAKPAIPALRRQFDDINLRPAITLALVRISRDEVAFVMDKLSSDLASRELSALTALAAMEPPPVEVLPALRPLLGDARVGGRALLALSRMDRITRAKAIPDLLSLLGSNTVPIQMRAAELLEELGVLAAPGLLQALKSPSTRTRVGAMVALRSDKFRDVVKDRTPLLDALEDADSVVRENAGETLSVLGVKSEEDRQRVTELLGRPEADLRRFGVRILLAGPVKEAMALDPRLEECLFDPDPGVRMNVCLSRVPLKSSLFPIIAAEDGSYEVRFAADLVSRKLHLYATPREGMENLRRLVRVAESKALLEIANTIEPRAFLEVPQLRLALEQITRGDDLTDRISAFVALSRLDNQMGLSCERFLQSIVLGWDAHARIEAALAFRRPSPVSIAILTRRRQAERDPDVRAAIDRALAGAK